MPSTRRNPRVITAADGTLSVELPDGTILPVGTTPSTGEHRSLTTATVVELAALRDAAADPSVEPHATLRAMMSGTATAADRLAHIRVALRQAGLTGYTAPEGTPQPKVTRHQYPVLEGCARGLSNTELASEMILNVETVKGHLGNLCKRFGVSTRVELVVEAVRCGVIPNPEA
jgi:DNA-binding NarL/FixJ family response regulator